MRLFIYAIQLTLGNVTSRDRLKIADLGNSVGILPVILALKRLKASYQTELTHELRCHHTTVKRAVDFLIEKGLVETVPGDGTVPNAGDYVALTAVGLKIAECLDECERKIS